MASALAKSAWVKNQLLAVVMHLAQQFGGTARLDSTIVPLPDEGAFGIAENEVEISKLGVSLYRLKERYVLAADGLGVTVEATEGFGPLPGILTRNFVYPAEIHEGGMASTYFMPLLGSQWTATYQIGRDRRSLEGKLVCEWATAHERARRKDLK